MQENWKFWFGLLFWCNFHQDEPKPSPLWNTLRHPRDLITAIDFSVFPNYPHFFQNVKNPNPSLPPTTPLLSRSSPSTSHSTTLPFISLCLLIFGLSSPFGLHRDKWLWDLIEWLFKSFRFSSPLSPWRMARPYLSLPRHRWRSEIWSFFFSSFFVFVFVALWICDVCGFVFFILSLWDPNRSTKTKANWSLLVWFCAVIGDARLVSVGHPIKQTRSVRGKNRLNQTKPTLKYSNIALYV